MVTALNDKDGEESMLDLPASEEKKILHVRICSFLCSLARYVGSLFPLVLIYTTRATLMTLMKFISSYTHSAMAYTAMLCQIKTPKHAIREKTITQVHSVQK